MMERRKIVTILVLALGVVLGSPNVSEAAPMGTAFTYQGQLNEDGTPADGLYDFEFQLYDAPSDGNQLGSTIEVSDFDVIDGYFTAELDFGSDVFDGDARWLEITVAHGDGSDPCTLSPRHELTPTPYAIYAKTTSGVDVPLELTGSESGSHIIKGRNSSIGPGSIGVVGEATASSGRGVYAVGAGAFGYGVYGEATYEGGSGRGVYGLARGLGGTGVKGLAHNSGDYTNYGGYFQANGSTGRGVYGLAFYEGAYTNYGGYFEASGSSGRGVYGEATGSSGTGVRGVASNNGNVINFGGYFEAAGGRGTGVRGYASSSSASTNRGGAFEASGSSGTGVLGLASGSSGTGVSGLASNSGDATNYGGHFEAWGSWGHAVYALATGIHGRGVSGYASNSGDYANYGGFFSASGSTGRGVYGVASSSFGRGVQGNGGDYDFYASGPGTNYGAASSIRWKSNIRLIDEALEKVVRLRGVYFNWDAEHGGEHDVGMIAEEVGEVLPEIVEYEKDGDYTSGMDYSKLTPLLVEAVKELKTEKDAELAELKCQLPELELLREENAELRRRIATLESVVAKMSALREGGTQ
ncbi:MAG: tail fiber domain-containing protein [Planctomycetota bacterium]|jgi:hypothetical protein